MLPLVFGNTEGGLDAALYDHIEIVRGGTGLMSSLSDPSATTNFVRKRPTIALQAGAGVSVGAWNNRRVDADVSGPFNASGSLRGRVVAAHENKESHLDRYAHKMSLFYGVVEADLTRQTTLAVGHNAQDNNAASPLWGAFPLHAAVRLNVTDRLMLLAGVRQTDYKSVGFAYGQNRGKTYRDKTTPYYGASFRLSDTYSLYGSYTKIFRPQAEVDINGDRLDPVTGKSYETGIKGEFLDKKLNASVAVFGSKQNSLAESAGFNPATFAEYFSGHTDQACPEK